MVLNVNLIACSDGSSAPLGLWFGVFVKTQCFYKGQALRPLQGALDEGCGELVCLSCWGSFSLYRLVGSRLCSEGDFFYCTSNPLSTFQGLPVSFLDKFGICFRFGPFCVALAMKLIASTFASFFCTKVCKFFANFS